MILKFFSKAGHECTPEKKGKLDQKFYFAPRTILELVSVFKEGSINFLFYFLFTKED